MGQNRTGAIGAPLPVRLIDPDLSPFNRGEEGDGNPTLSFEEVVSLTRALLIGGLDSIGTALSNMLFQVATNSAIYHHMIEDMDINAGTILDGTETVEQVGQRIFEEIIAVASGKKTKSELAGLGDDEFAPWLLGAQF